MHVPYSEVRPPHADLFKINEEVDGFYSFSQLSLWDWVREVLIQFHDSFLDPALGI